MDRSSECSGSHAKYFYVYSQNDSQVWEFLTFDAYSSLLIDGRSELDPWTWKVTATMYSDCKDGRVKTQDVLETKVCVSVSLDKLWDDEFLIQI